MPGQDGAVKLQKIMSEMRENPIKEIDGNKVVKYEDYKERKVYEGDKVTALEGYDVTDVLKYYFADGSFVAIRPSGTEPKCKVYFSMKDTDINKAKNKNDRYHLVLKELLK